MTFSRLGRFPLEYMMASKSVLALLGFGFSLVLRSVYRHWLRDDSGIAPQLFLTVAASYALSLPWTGFDNLLDVPLRRLLLGQDGALAASQLFVGSLYNAFVLLAWSMLYLAIKHFHALSAQRERAIRAEGLAAAARLQALRFQIQPNLLFNSLNALSTLIVEQRTEEASRMVSRISDFLRQTLTAPEAQEITLEEELKFVGKYLDIERVRFPDRLSLDVDLADETRDCRVPTFLLQPVVENAVRHAIEPAIHGGCIRISARREGRELVIEVDDASYPGGVTSKARDGLGGIGLANTRSRLAQLYGSNQRLESHTMPSGGHRVQVRLPFAQLGAVRA